LILEIYNFTAMTSPCEVRLYGDNKEISDACAKDILQECKRLEKKYNFYDTNSFLHSLNTRSKNIIDSETKALLQRAKQYYKKTNKIFDITLNTFHKPNEYKSIKEYENMKEQLKQYIGCEHYEIKKNKLYFDNEFTKIDLGGFVKEYSVDQAVKIIKKYKISSALVNFGGDIYAHGLKPNKSKFKISITNPIDTNKKLFNIEIENQALTTSASYERNTILENKEISHILNIKESSEIISATVLSSSCVEAGVYSTALMCDEIKCTHEKFLVNKNLSVIR